MSYRAKSFGHLLILEEFSRSTEVYHLDIHAILRYENYILWLEIAVNDIAVVAICDCGHNLPHQFACCRLVEDLELLNAIEEFPTLQVLSNQVVVCVILVQFIQFNDIRVVEIFEDIHLGE